MRTKAAGPSGCSFGPASGEGLGITLSEITIQIDPGQYVKGARDACEDLVADVDAADSAWICQVSDGKFHGAVVKDSTYVGIDVPGLVSDRDPSDAEAQQILKTLLPAVTFP